MQRWFRRGSSSTVLTIRTTLFRSLLLTQSQEIRFSLSEASSLWNQWMNHFRDGTGLEIEKHVSGLMDASN